MGLKLKKDFDSNIGQTMKTLVSGGARLNFNQLKRLNTNLKCDYAEKIHQNDFK